MDCYPPCVSCSGLCRVPPLHTQPSSAGRVARGGRQDTGPSVPSPAPIRHRHGWTALRCGHVVPADEITMTVLGSGLGAQPWCDRCGDFVSIRGKRGKADPPSGEMLF